MSGNIRVQLEDGNSILIEQESSLIEQEVSDDELEGKFSEILPSIISICNDFSKAIKAISPSKAIVQFGIKVGIETKGLVALIGKANADTNFQVTLEWGASPEICIPFIPNETK